MSTLNALKAFADGRGDIASLKRQAESDPTNIGSRVIAFETEYQNSAWAVGETRERAGRLYEALTA